jgi:phage shock protein C
VTTAYESKQDDGAANPVAERRLYRTSTQKVVAGVCSGLGEYFAIDPVWFRIGFVVLAIAGGSGILIYLLMWLIVPPQPDGYIAPDSGRGSVTGVAVIGVVFVIAGTVALVNTAAPWLGQYVWPVVLLMGGLVLLLGGLKR